jgi:hypothetical protein
LQHADQVAYDFSQSGFLAYQHFNIVISLEALIRQQNADNDPMQAKLIDLLPRLRDGTSTQADWEILKTSLSSHLTNLLGFEKDISIFNDNASVDKTKVDLDFN